jgi:hypothetical protein
MAISEQVKAIIRAQAQIYIQANSKFPTRVLGAGRDLPSV